MIKTERLYITPMSLDDAQFVYDLVNSPGWMEHIGDRNVHSLKDARNYIQEKMIDHYNKNGYGNYKMTLKGSGEAVGCVSLYNRETVEGVDIGFALLPDHYGKGYAYEGSLALKEYAIHTLNLNWITAFTTPENVASQKLIKKLGFDFKKKFEWEDTGETLLLFEFISKEE